MKYTVFYSRESEKYLRRLTPTSLKRILSRIEKLAENPFEADNNIVKLVETESSFRLRIGDIRVIYYVDIKKRSIYINKIAPRGSAYSS